MNDTKERILEVSADLFQRQGIAATGIKQIVTAADAQFSSLYHHFPGGKEQLAAEAILRSGRLYGQLIPAYFESTADFVSAVESFFDEAAQHLIDTDFADACPIATVSLEIASSNETLRVVCATVFEEWIEDLERRLLLFTVDSSLARNIATVMVAVLEGAFLLSRVTRSTDPIAVARDFAVAAVKAALDRNEVSKN